MLIGTYTKTQTNGIFVYKFDTKTGELTFESKTEGVNNPSYLAINNEGTKVYSVNESGTDRKGGVSSFDFNTKTGNISLINKQETIGSGPCYISVANDNKFIFTANYGSGSISVLPLKSNGSIGELSQLIQHEGSSIDKSRQTAPHAHSVIFSNDGKTLLSANLGTDKLYAYNYNSSLEKPLQDASQPFVNIEPGFGPRHFAFNKSGNKLYLLSEMKAMITVFDYKDKVLTKNSIVNLNLDGVVRNDGGADIHLSNDGKFLYATNRGNINEIVIFKIDKKDGTLKRLAAVDCKGKMPRNFIIDPTDKFLLVANQNSDDIYIFKRNKKTGMLTYNNQMLKIGSPVCLKMTAVK
ncbi:hypothetical protein A5893_00200 [Pedobacter psychrophilus]|uniref:3-carboxymuconate cyclase n=1 Tax=Pedobacter psychrophilus TaxID=1826909 RepID=A0A179DL06_9SPHI|nr:lactonase family protein [Pedobacter psychrophilus]OAQ41574.1 hypothetical protein A5893_00200 [Pedobacter psychrophilus]